MRDIDGAATTLFGVGFLCVCALLYALVANTGLCCALKCCWNPVRASRRVAPADGGEGAMMQPLVPPPLAGAPALAGAPVPAPGVPPHASGIPPPGVKGAWTE